jgi:hypothetical protein
VEYLVQASALQETQTESNRSKKMSGSSGQVGYGGAQHQLGASHPTTNQQHHFHQIFLLPLLVLSGFFSRPIPEPGFQHMAPAGWLIL